MAEEKEVDWKKVFTAALVGDVADAFLDPVPVVGKVLGDVFDITYTLPQMRKELPGVDKDIAYLATLAETIPVIELLPNWGFLAAGSFIRTQVLGKEASSPKELFGLPERGTGLKLGTARTGEERGRGRPRTEEERLLRHETLFEKLGLPALEELFGLPERGTGLKLGTARTGEERGRGKPRTEEERFSRHKKVLEESGLPALEDFLPFLKKRK